MRFSLPLNEYQVIGRKLPSEKEPSPQLYRMRIFAPNELVAKSRFWFFISRLKKLKKTAGQVVHIYQVPQGNGDVIQNYGIWLRYDSSKGTHNVYKEFRAISTVDAVSKAYMEMGGRHKARSETIHIVNVSVLANEDCRRQNIIQFHDPELKFPQLQKLVKLDKIDRQQFVSKAKAKYL